MILNYLLVYFVVTLAILLAANVLAAIVIRTGRVVADALPWTTTCTNCWRWTTKSDYCPSCHLSTLKRE